MRNTFTRCLSVLLVLVLLSPLVISANAIEEPSDGYLGTSEDITGYIIPEENDNSPSSRVVILPIQPDLGGNQYTEIFSITATHVTQLLTSNHGGKSFEIDSLPNTAQYLLISGRLNHSLEENGQHLADYISIGVCYYTYSYFYDDYIYDSVYSIYYDHGYAGGTLLEEKFKIDDYLEDDITYYTFVKNSYPAGYVHGTVSLYYSAS